MIIFFVYKKKKKLRYMASEKNLGKHTMMSIINTILEKE